MNKACVVAVFAPTGDDGKDGELGTGYPVGPGWILSSGHVVAPKNRNEKYPLLVARIPLKAETRDKPDWQEVPAEPVWIGKGKLDAALIRCPQSWDPCDFGHLSDTWPRESDEWHSRGFPKVTRVDEQPQPHDFNGEVKSMGDEDDRFNVDVKNPPEHPDGWDGASGMPIFVNGRILGIVAEVPSGMKSQFFRVVPVWQLLQDDDFRDHLNWDPRRDYLGQVKTALRDDLRSHQNAAVALADVVGVGGPGSDAQAGELADALLERSSLQELFDHARKAQWEIRQRVDDERSVDYPAIADIARLVEQLLPPRADWAAVERVKRSAGDSGSALIAVPAALDTVAEVIMAAVDARPAKFVPPPPRTEGQFPRGRFCLPEPGEGGRDADGNQFKQDLITHLVNFFEGDIGDDPKVEQTFEDYLAQRFVAEKQRGIPKLLVDRINKQIAKKAKGPPVMTYYVVVKHDADDRRCAVVAALQQKFKALVFLQLEDPRKRNDCDYDDYLSLADVMLAANPDHPQD